MTVPLYLIASGDLFFVGLFLAGIGAVGAAQYPRSGRAIVWSGLVLTFSSAMAVTPIVYIVLLLNAGIWHSSRRRTAGIRAGVTPSLLIVASGALILGLRGPGRPLDLPRDRPVYLLGDSISAGVGASDSGTWPQVLAERVGIRVTNLARPGATLSDGIAQARSIPDDPAIVLIELGGNDLLAGATPEQFQASLLSLLGILAATDRQLLMFELPLLPSQYSYGRIQRQTCNEYRVRLVPRSVLAGAVTLSGNTEDGLHLSAEGHRLLAAKVERWLWGPALAPALCRILSASTSLMARSLLTPARARGRPELELQGRHMARQSQTNAVPPLDRPPPPAISTLNIVIFGLPSEGHSSMPRSKVRALAGIIRKPSAVWI